MLFYFDTPAREHSDALEWLRTHADRQAIVVTMRPQFTFLATGLRAVLPPLEADVAEARSLLRELGSVYLVLESGEATLERYLAPVVRGDPAAWEPSYRSPSGFVTLYRSTQSGGHAAGRDPLLDALPAP
jgi:hypothetical protein